MLTADRALDALWRRFRSAGPSPSHLRTEDLASLLTELGNSQQALDLLAAVADLPASRSDTAVHTSPQSLVRFVSSLAAELKPASVLDPTCGFGLMLRAVVDAAKPVQAIGVDINPETARGAQQLLRGRATIITGDVLQEGDQLAGPFDFIIADPPMSLRLPRGGPDRDQHEGNNLEFAEQLIHWSLKRLAPAGTLAVLTTQRLATDERFHARLQAGGHRIRAFLHLPAGTLASTAISCYLVLIDHQPQGDVFIAQLERSPDTHAPVLSNLLAHRRTRHPELGVLRPLGSFRGFPQLEAAHRLQSRLEGSRFQLVDATAAFTSVRTHAPSPSSDVPAPDQNDFFLDRTGRLAETPAPDARTSRPLIHLRVNPAVLDPEYFRRWLTADIGRHTFDSVSLGSLSRSITLESLQSLKLPLPPIDEQKQLARTLSDVDGLRKQLEELEQSCWDGRDNPTSIAQKVATLNNPERFEDWIESLPFPLATVLWRHHAAHQDPHHRIKTLCNFFEALAAFLATLHLSAFQSVPSCWSEHQSKLIASLSAAKLRIDLATFGTWKCIVEYLSKTARTLLNSKERDLARELYALSDDRLLATLLAPALVSLLNEAVAIRNHSLGHAGVMSTSDAKSVESELVALVGRLRTHLGDAWSRYELVLAGQSSFRDGVYHHHIPRVMGTRSPFPRVHRTTRAPLEDGKLYLLGEGSLRGLPLLPFVRMMPSPSNALNACYFFNRVHSGKHRFVSYHFEAQSEVCEAFSDTAAAISELSRPADTPPSEGTA